MALGITLTIVAVVIVAAAAVYLRRRTHKQAADESAYQKGLDALIAGHHDDALKHLARAVREDSRNVDAYIKLGALLRERGQVKQAIQAHRELLVKRRLPTAIRSEIIKNLALDLAEGGRWGEVVEQIRSLPRGERGDRRMLTLARDAYETVGDFERALTAHREMLKSGVAGEPSAGVYRAHVAMLALQRGDSVRAKTELTAAMQEDKGAVLGNLYLGDIAAQAGDLERASAHWMALVTERPDCAYLAFERLEKAYFELGDFGRMLRVYEDVVTRAPSSVHAYCGLSRMQERKGDIDEAVGTAREAIKHEGDTFIGHRQLIDVLVRNQRFEEAALAAQTLLKRPPDVGAPTNCPSCRAPLKNPGWRCPACRAWLDVC
jgi:lipopolysaccharide biosynthesis regulator YciM